MKAFLLACILAYSFAAHALEPFVISDIRVEGLERIEPGTVFNYLPLKVGDEIDDEAAEESIRALFKTGFFNDIKLNQDGDVLVVVVEERPSVASITFNGNDEFDDAALTEGMEQVDFAEGRIFNQSALDRVVQDLKSQYFSLGRYSASVESSVEPLERNRVAITFDIDEGVVAKIKKINIVGNEAFEDKKLRKRFNLSTKKVFNFLSKKDQYSKQKLEADLETLRSFYQDQGYLEFKLESTQVSISDNREHIFITIAINEGESFSVSDISIESTAAVSAEELKSLLTFISGDVYSRKAVSESRAAITDRLANDGYAFANVNAIPDIDKENKTVSFAFAIDIGRRVYIRRIDISGNTATRDEVIRRELRQFEGAWYSAEDIQRSRVRLQRLGFFDDVRIDTPQVPGTNDQVDLEVVVKERSTGTFLFGVGFSDEDGVLLQANVSQENLFGSGKELDLDINTSDVSRVVSLGYTNPYYTLNGISRGFRISSRRIDATEANTAEYIAETELLGVEYQIPLSEFNSINFGFAGERIDLSDTDETPPEFEEFIAQNPESDNWKLTSSWSRDTRDSIIYPTTGFLRRFSLEASLPGSDLTYYKVTGRASWFRPLTDKFVVRLTGELGIGDGYDDLEVLPFFENFFAGGPNSVRGYD
ncbi:MAG: outer membrane protein assembly factor BamA, partial [Gammaproteobacteria bacterium]|nr:outer membrane protein assembly factor BamA [Gammaproteobacteria bacterium]